MRSLSPTPRGRYHRRARAREPGAPRMLEVTDGTIFDYARPYDLEDAVSHVSYAMTR
jgi:hypothetical protein